MASNKTIHIEGNGRRLEFDAGEAGIYPGYLLELSSTAGDVLLNNGASIAVPRLYAVEDDLQGNDIDDVYASGERVQLVAALPGDFINAVLADGENVAVGAELESNGAGQLQANTSAGEAVCAIAMEALNLTASADGDVLSERRIKVLVV